MPVNIEARESVTPAWNPFDWTLRGQNVTGLLKELTPVVDNVQKIGVALALPQNAENIQMNFTVREVVDRSKSGQTITKEECFVVSYWDPALKSGRLILFPRELHKWQEEKRISLYIQVQDFQVYKPGGEKNLY